MSESGTRLKKLRVRTQFWFSQNDGRQREYRSEQFDRVEGVKADDVRHRIEGMVTIVG